MELRILEYFLQTVRCGSISEAARQLHITQPTLSRQLQALEDELKTPLFVRSRRNQKLECTPAGQELAVQAESIVSLVEKTFLSFTKRNGLSGKVTIASVESPALKRIARAAGKFTQDNPSVSIQMLANGQEQIPDLLMRSEADFGLYGESGHKEGLDYLPLPFADELGLLIPADHPLALLDAIRPQDLAGEKLILPYDTNLCSELRGWASSHQGIARISGRCNTAYTACLMVEEGLGLAFCAEHVVPLKERTKVCFKPLKPSLKSRLSLVWRKEGLGCAAAKAFLAAMRQEFEQHSES